MLRRFMPILLGGVFGALLVSIVPGPGGTADGGMPGTGAAQFTDSSYAGETSDTVSVATPDELARIADPMGRRSAALGLFEANGGDAAAADRIAAFLPEDEGINFRIHAIAMSGARDLNGAIDAALALASHDQRRLALSRLAPVLAASDPLGAIAAIEAIGLPGLKIGFVESLLDAWVMLDPDGVFAYLESSGSSPVPPSEATFAALAASDPERLLAIAEGLRRDVASLASVAALESLIEQDPAAALDRIESLSVGADSSQLRSSAIEVYGERDPEAAWAWAVDSEAQGSARLSVIRGIHRNDPDLAWEIMQSQWNSPDPAIREGVRDYFLNYVNIVVGQGKSAEDIIIGLDRILTLDGARDTGNFMVNLNVWAREEPEAALDWSLRNLDRINASSMLTALSSGLARTNPELARQTLLRLEEPHQVSWSAGVARTLAENDLFAARAWTFEFPRGAVRDAGLSEVIRGEAQGGTVDRQLFDMFSSDAARSEAASRAARLFGCNGQAAVGLELAEAYITDRRLLESTRRRLASSPNSGSMSFECATIP